MQTLQGRIMAGRGWVRWSASTPVSAKQTCHWWCATTLQIDAHLGCSVSHTLHAMHVVINAFHYVRVQFWNCALHSIYLQKNNERGRGTIVPNIATKIVWPMCAEWTSRSEEESKVKNLWFDYFVTTTVLFTIALLMKLQRVKLPLYCRAFFTCTFVLLLYRTVSRNTHRWPEAVQSVRPRGGDCNSQKAMTILSRHPPSLLVFSVTCTNPLRMSSRIRKSSQKGSALLTATKYVVQRRY